MKIRNLNRDVNKLAILRLLFIYLRTAGQPLENVSFILGQTRQILISNRVTAKGFIYHNIIHNDVMIQTSKTM